MKSIPLTDKQAAIFAYIRSEIETKRMPPTVREIGTKFGMTVNGAVGFLTSLVRKGYITREANHARGIRLVGDFNGETLREENERLKAENKRMRDGIEEVILYCENPSANREIIANMLRKAAKVTRDVPSPPPLDATDPRHSVLTGFQIEDICDEDD